MRIAFNRICCHHRVLFPAKGFPQKDSRSHGCVYCHRHGAPGSRKVPCRCPSLPLRPSGPEPHRPPSGSPRHLPTIPSLLPEAPWGELPHPAQRGMVAPLVCHQGKHPMSRDSRGWKPPCTQPAGHETHTPDRMLTCSPASRTGGGKGLGKPVRPGLATVCGTVEREVTLLPPASVYSSAEQG